LRHFHELFVATKNSFRRGLIDYFLSLTLDAAIVKMIQVCLHDPDLILIDIFIKV
jgi:hypothetical protein